MDDDDCDIFADVTKFCNSNNLEDAITKAEKDSTEFNDIPLHEFESPCSTSPKKESRKTSPIKKSTAKNLSPKRTRSGKTREQDDVQNNANTSNSQEDGLEIISRSSLEECIEQFMGRGRGRRRGRGRGTTRARGRTSSLQSVISTLSSLNSLPPQPPPASQRGRARRRYMAELAARSSVVGVVDLVTSPSLPLLNLPESVVSVDSDDDDCTDVQQFDVSFDSENPEISVKVKWGDDIEIFAHRKYQKFSDLFNIFAEREKVAVSDIVLNLDDRIILPIDTPESIDYKITQFISGRTLKNSVTKHAVRKTKTNANELTLKIQSDAWKKPISVSCKKLDTFRILYIKCSEELNVPVENIKLTFDGEPLNLDSRPADLELEGEEIIDCRLIR